MFAKSFITIRGNRCPKQDLFFLSLSCLILGVSFGVNQAAPRTSRWARPCEPQPLVPIYWGRVHRAQLPLQTRNQRQVCRSAVHAQCKAAWCHAALAALCGFTHSHYSNNYAPLWPQHRAGCQEPVLAPSPSRAQSQSEERKTQQKPPSTGVKFFSTHTQEFASQVRSA